MKEFQRAYKTLNAAQRAAVDYINGPLLVIAGPGTGKTQLLSTRVGNILDKGAAEARNILCLTYTEAGRVAMQQRLIDMLGPAGHQVAVHTFHSFGSEIINTHPAYFDQGAVLAAADELTIHELLRGLLEELPHDNPLTAKNNGQFTHLRSLVATIGDLKKAGITPEELREIAIHNLDWLKLAEPILVELFDVPRFSSISEIGRTAEALLSLEALDQTDYDHPIIRPLSLLCQQTLGPAILAAQEQGKPKPINDWKKPWFGKDEHGKAICPQRPISQKLLAVADLYSRYQQALVARGLYDFEDMIMRVVSALETRPDLTYELQETYHYFLVDEFQDTNGAQLRLLKAIADHPVHEGSPNLMVVGDDDQAIYAFQGAELSNMLDFTRFYPATKVVTLQENYRSSQRILDIARAIITQGEDRLEASDSEISKQLKAAGDRPITKTVFMMASTPAEEYRRIARAIKKQARDGVPLNDIAIISREHKYLQAITPYLHDEGLRVSYERRDNVLEHPVTRQLLTMARVVDFLAANKLQEANGLLPELLSCPFFGVATKDLWQLSLQAYKSRDNHGASRLWLEIMTQSDSPDLKRIAAWLNAAAVLSRSLSAEEVLDVLIGNEETALPDEENEEAENPENPPKANNYVSPFKRFYFGEDILQQRPADYLTLLSNLTAIRNKFRQYHPDQNLNLHDFVQFVDLHIEAGIGISAAHDYQESLEAIRLLTAHGSKGLEFESVFLIEASKSVWDAGRRPNAIPLTQNLSVIRPAGNADDNLRLLYVALTRAKSRLSICRSQLDIGGKEQLPLRYLDNEQVNGLLELSTVIEHGADQQLVTDAERDWRDWHWRVPTSDMRSQLATTLEQYQLSATHLNNFLDVTRGGPRAFLLNNLLRFPEAMSPAAAYGSAVHSALEKLHVHMNSTGKLLPGRELNRLFSYFLKTRRLSPADEQKYSLQGQHLLSEFLKQRGKYVTPDQKTEQGFSRQGSTAGEARLTGKLDVLKIEKDGSISVVDYKTGKALMNWSEQGKSQGDKLKCHRYRQQLFFYALLINQARDYGMAGHRAKQGSLVFVEPDSQGKITELTLDITDVQELSRLEQLIKAVWKHIQDLDFPDVAGYPPTLEGVKSFEDDLIEGHKKITG